MTKAAIWSLIIVATGMVILGLSFFKDTLVQIVLALLLFIGAGGVGRWIHRKAPALPVRLAAALGVVLALGLIGGLAWTMTVSVLSFADDAIRYRERLDIILAGLRFGAHDSGLVLNTRAIFDSLDLPATLSAIAGALQATASNTIFIAIYMIFLLAAAARATNKLDELFADPLKRQHMRNVLTAIREGVEQYLWMQTALSVVAAFGSYAILLLLGVQHAMFWACLVFLLNYIPTVGAMVAILLPSLFCVLQYGGLAHASQALIALSVLHVVAGHFFRGRLTKRSLSLSNFVVLLALQVWGAIWGLTGAFLAAPLTIIIMIVVAQFEHSRWIAVLLSAKGAPANLAADPSTLAPGLLEARHPGQTAPTMHST